MAEDLFTRREMFDAPLEGRVDFYKGITIDTDKCGCISPDDFHGKLSASIDIWKSSKRRGIWLRIPLSQSEFVPVAAKLGFSFHHTLNNKLVMTRWLPEQEPNTLPDYATHNIGVAGFVVNQKNQLLLVQEKWLHSHKVVHWKLPGGQTDLGEDLPQTAIRETEEETGIKTEFVAMVTFRHMHGYQWGIDDLYFVCLLRPLNTDIQVNPSEIADAKWMDVDAYIEDPETSPFNRLIAEAYNEGLAMGHFLQPTYLPHYIRGRPDLMMYQLKAFPTANSVEHTSHKANM